MNRIKLFALAAALTAGSFAFAPVTEAGKCGPELCPEVYKPVICSDGVTYSNQCFADAACATDCKPAGDVAE